MEIAGQPTSTDSAAAIAPASPSPSPDTSHAAANAGITAPPANAAREAYDRLAAGKGTPESINRELYTPKTPKPADDQPAAAAAKPAEQPGPKFPDSIDAKDVQVLKRAKMDPATWAHIPPANQKAILTGLRAQQAQATREFQAKQRANGASKDATATGTSPTDPALTAEDAGTREEADAAGNAAAVVPGADDATIEQEETTQQAAAANTPPANLAAPIDLSAIFSPADRATLQQLGGDDLADIVGRGLGGVVQHMQAREAQLVGVLDFLFEHHIGAEFNATVGDLANQPGMDGLKNDHADYSKNAEALRAKAMLLHRAAANPRSYTFREATRDAAASLFKTNTQQATQAALLSRRRASLTGSPERGDQLRPSGQPMTPKERNAQIYANLANGMSAGAAAAAVGG